MVVALRQLRDHRCLAHPLAVHTDVGAGVRRMHRDLGDPLLNSVPQAVVATFGSAAVRIVPVLRRMW
ncbi:MAG: hypothetical protein ACODAE_09600 [Gemmatimonadota bacterium]